MAFLTQNRLPLDTWQFWMVVVTYFLIPGVVMAHSYESMTAILARVNVSYEEPVTGLIRSVTAEIGRFADNKVGNAQGLLFTGVSETTSVPQVSQAGCSLTMDKAPPKIPWIALFIKGSCPDEQKVRNAKALNASAVLLFGNDQETYLQREKKFKDGPIVIYLLYRKGELFWHLVQSGTRVHIAISRGQEVKFRITSINRTSVLFVSVSFIVLMVVSLAWLIFYYIQRFRYITAKDRLARHLTNAAKKAVAKIPDRHLKKDDIEIKEKDSCAVCIEPYLQGDTVRSLPCKHNFHKTCVDPWLLDHRTCPMCKMDILKHYGYAPSEEGQTGMRRAEEGYNAAPEGRRPLNANSVQSTGLIPAQVAIISEGPVVMCHTNQLLRSSSNPVEETFSPTPSPMSSIGTTTSAVIRSMIQSARTRVSPTRHLSAVHCPSTATSVPLSNDEATSVEPAESAVMIEDEVKEDEITISETSNGSVDPPVVVESHISPEPKESPEIELLVREILDLESDIENASPRQPSESDDQLVDLPEMIIQREDRSYSPTIAILPSDAFAQSSNKLPAVDCQADGTPSVQSLVQPGSRRVSLARFGSVTTADLEDDEETSSRRPPSSSIVSISHS